LHIAIDDTYGPVGTTDSIYVTGARRTHVAVVFGDHEVDHVRQEIKECLCSMTELIPTAPAEFHFVDIYNRREPWNQLPERANLGIFAAFAEIYSHYRWKVFLQTIDDQIFTDHPEMHNVPDLDGLNSSDRSDLSLLWLCIKLRIAFKVAKPPLRLLVDQGRRSPGTSFGNQIFGDWGDQFSGQYSASCDEPLIQIADFLAFLINRSTHLQMKNERTETDNWFLDLVGKMKINCEDLVQASLPIDFTVTDFDELHSSDRIRKGFK
jgi:hypothetical protein